MTTDDQVIRFDGVGLRYGKVHALSNVSLDVPAGCMAGLIGPDGVGKSSLLALAAGVRRMQTGRIKVLGCDMSRAGYRAKVGPRIAYMPQGLGRNLYPTLSVRENIDFFGRLFGHDAAESARRIKTLTRATGLYPFIDRPAGKLSGGMKQKLGLCSALIHDPDLLILDEPTTGVDLGARDEFWRILIELSRGEGVTIFLSTHFMNEAERCDRVSLMHEGKVLATGAPTKLAQEVGVATLEDAFIHHLEAADGHAALRAAPLSSDAVPQGHGRAPRGWHRWFDPRRMFSHARREALELWRDPVRMTLAILGSAILMFVMGYGINLDVEDVTFAMLDNDQTAISRDYTANLQGSRYFIERSPIKGYADLDRRMRAGEISLALEIPPGFGRDIARGRPVAVGAWIDGAMPTLAGTVQAYVQGIHLHWLELRARDAGYVDALAGPVTTEIRFRYNADLRSLDAMVPAVIPLLLLLIPAMLSSLSVVREKELGSITNFYVTPTTRLEFLLGKQIPYVVLSMGSFLMLTALAVTVFGVTLTGSFATLAAGALLYVSAATAIGLVFSAFTRSRPAAMFGTAVLTILPAISFTGLVDPVSALQGFGRVIGEIYPGSLHKSDFIVRLVRTLREHLYFQPVFWSLRAL